MHTEPPEPLLLRPLPQLRWGTTAAAALIGLLLLSPAGALGGAPALLTALAVEALLCTLLWWRLSGIRLLVPAERIDSAGLFRRRTHPRTAVATVLRATLIQPRGGFMPAVFVLDARGGVLARLNGGTYAPEDLDRLAARLALPTTGPDRPVTAVQLTRTHPGIVSFAEARPFATGCVAGLAVTLVVVVVSLITVAGMV